MSASTVPMFSPDGSLGDIPSDQMMAASKAGATPAVKIQSPDGSTGYVPAPRTHEAIAAGGKLLPIEEQEIQHPGFWHNMYSDLAGMAKGAYHAVADPLTDTHEDLVRKNHEEQAADAAPPSAEHLAHGAVYRNVTTPLAEAVGVNVPGMEQSAAEGDVAGVAGHAAAPAVALAATEGVARGVPAIRDAIPSDARAKAGFQEVSRAAGAHTVPVTPELSNALMKYQELVDAGGSQSVTVRKLVNRLTAPNARPLTYDEARLFQSNISRLSADEAQRLTPVMKRQVSIIAKELNSTVADTAGHAGKLQEYQAAMKEYSQAKTLADRKEVLKKWGVRGAAAAALGATGAAGVKLYQDLNK